MTVEAKLHRYYQASADELGIFTDDMEDAERLAAQNKLAKRVLEESGGKQGYTDATTFRVIMTGSLPPGDELADAQGTKAAEELFRSLKPYEYAAGEPYAFSTRTLGYMGIILESPFANGPGEALTYSIRKLRGESVYQADHGKRLWGQVLLHSWRAGTDTWRVNLDWDFHGTSELAVIERSLGKAKPTVHSTPESFSDLVGMPAIRRHYAHNQPGVVGKLPDHFATVRDHVARLAIRVPKSIYPPVNDR